MNTGQIKLPVVIDMTTAQALKGDILLSYHEGQAIDLDASEVERLGTPGLQLLWSVMTSFGTSGLSIRVLDPSPAFLAAFEDAGLDFSNRFQSEAGTH